MEMTIGERITQLRKQRNLTVNKTATLSGVSQSYLRELELGQYNNPTIDVLEAICGALGVSMSEFFDEQKEMRDMNDKLMEEISELGPEQREELRNFLKILRTKPYNQHNSANEPSYIVKRR